MAKVEDVAAYILNKRGPMTTMKLQKLCYYSHAWHLVWEEKPLFPDRIEAWANGPVVTSLYRQHRGRFQVAAGELGGDACRLDESERTTIDSVLEFYGKMTAHQLSELTHREAPWKQARGSLSEFERGGCSISDAAMFEYYDSLTSAES